MPTERDPMIEEILKRIVIDVDTDFCNKHGIQMDNDEIDSSTIPMMGKEARLSAGRSLSALRDGRKR